MDEAPRSIIYHKDFETINGIIMMETSLPEYRDILAKDMINHILDVYHENQNILFDPLSKYKDHEIIFEERIKPFLSANKQRIAYIIKRSIKKNIDRESIMKNKKLIYSHIDMLIPGSAPEILEYWDTVPDDEDKCIAFIIDQYMCEEGDLKWIQ